MTYEEGLGLGAFVGFTTWSYQRRVVRRLRRMNHPAASVATVAGVHGMTAHRSKYGGKYMWLSYTTEDWYGPMNWVGFPPMPPCNYARETVTDALLLLGEYLERLKDRNPKLYLVMLRGNFDGIR